MSNSRSIRGFTLIELSIVLVIIGLIAGGVLVGRDLINASTVRAQIAQIEKYQQAVNTFRVKYGYLPGDIPDPDASRLGFAARGTLSGQGDGDGTYGMNESSGEQVMFWRDLSTAKLIDGTFSLASSTVSPNSYLLPSTANPTYRISSYFPDAKIGNGNIVYVWGYGSIAYFGLSVPNPSEGVIIGGGLHSDPGLTVQQAYGIDSKIDDGLPQSGSIKAFYVDIYKSSMNAGDPEGFSSSSDNIAWATASAPNTYEMGDYDGENLTGGISSTTTSPHWDDNSDPSKLCYSNGKTLSPEQYNMAYSTKMNCALSFKFQ